MVRSGPMLNEIPKLTHSNLKLKLKSLPPIILNRVKYATQLCLAFKRHCPSISLCFFACVSPSFSLCLSGYMVSEVYVSDMQNSNRRIIQWIKSKEYPAPLWQQSKYSDAQCFTKMSTAWKITVLKPASSVHGAPVLSGRRSQILSVSM